jgi:hypothetical protein
MLMTYCASCAGAREALLLLSLNEDETEWRHVVLAQEPRRRRNSAAMESKTD